MPKNIIEPLNADFDSLAKSMVKAITPPILQTIAGTPHKPIQIGEKEIECYVLDDKTRVLTQATFLEAMGRHRKANVRREGEEQLPAILQGKSIYPFISSELMEKSQPIRFQLPTGGTASGYRAEILPMVCEVFLQARDAGALPSNQRHIAEEAEILVRALAQVGIIALVDEATGYQDARAKDALAEIFDQFLTDERQKWTSTFPIDFYKEIYRLRGWEFSTLTTKRPSVVANWTDNFVYDRLAPQITQELRKKNPKGEKRRKNKHFQWLSPEHGHPRLKEHLSGVIALLRASETWDQFLVSLDRAYPRFGNTIEMPLTGGSNAE